MEPSQDRSLVPGPSRELIAVTARTNRVLGEMVKSSLTLAKEVAAAEIDPETLVREAKRIQGSSAGMTPENIQAFNLFLRAAKAGHAEAQCHLANCYALGNGVQKNIKSALKWLQRSADQIFGHRTTLKKFYGLFELRTDVSRDYIEAANGYRTAAEQASADEQFEIGECLREGIGVHQDYCEAAAWYLKAAKQGHASAQYKLGLYFRGGEKDGFYEHLAVALSNYFFVERRFLNPSFDLPFDVLNAETGEIIIHANERITRPLLLKLAKDYAQFGIAPSPIRDKLQEIVEKFDQGAVVWFQRAAEQGHSGAQQNLATCYRLGRGTQIDPARAYAWFCIAASKGAPEAGEGAATLAAEMPPSELETAQRLYIEFKEKYSSQQ